MVVTDPRESIPDTGLAESLFLSFYSQQPYRAAAVLWRVKTWFYILLLVLVVQFPNSVRTMREIERETTRVVDRVSTDLPGLTVRAGKLVLPGGQHRQEINLSLFGLATRFIVDPTLVEPVFPNDAGTVVLITGEDLAVRFPDGQDHRWSLGLAGDFVVTRQLLTAYGDMFVRVTWLVLPCLLLLGGWVVLLFRVLLLALGGWMVFPHSRMRLPFGAAFRVAVVAAGPAAVLEAVLAAVGAETFGWQAASLLMAVSYFLYGLRVLMPPPEPSDTDP